MKIDKKKVLPAAIVASLIVGVSFASGKRKEASFFPDHVQGEREMRAAGGRPAGLLSRFIGDHPHLAAGGPGLDRSVDRFGPILSGPAFQVQQAKPPVLRTLEPFAGS